jgi:hypothetical protein
MIDADVPTILWGPPGVGKTAHVLALARARGVHVEVLIGSTLDPVDVGGYLVPHEGRVTSIPPPWAARLHERPGSWLFLDELSCAPASVRAALLRVVHDRHCAGIDLRCRVIAAANDADMAAAGGELDPATANRMAHFEFRPVPAEWCAGELSGWGEHNTDTALAAARAAVTSYISAHAAALLAPPDGSAPPRGWPSPRSWSHVARACAHTPRPKWRSVAAALVGPAAAGEWAEWLAALDLPAAEDLLAGLAKLPTRPDQLRASLLSATAAALLERSDRDQRLLALDALLQTVRPDQGLASAQAVARSDVSLPPIVRSLGLRVQSL